MGGCTAEERKDVETVLPNNSLLVERQRLPKGKERDPGLQASRIKRRGSRDPTSIAGPSTHRRDSEQGRRDKNKLLGV